MRLGWRSSWSGVRTPVRLSVQGPAGEASATAPFSNPLHQWYCRWMGGVSRPHSFFSLWYVSALCQVCPRVKQKSKASATTHLQQRAPPLVPPCVAGTAFPPHSPLRPPARGIRTPVFSAAAGCAAAAVLAPKTYFCLSGHRNEVFRQNFKVRGWAFGPLTPTMPHQPSVVSTAS